MKGRVEGKLRKAGMCRVQEHVNEKQILNNGTLEEMVLVPVTKPNPLQAWASRIKESQIKEGAQWLRSHPRE